MTRRTLANSVGMFLVGAHFATIGGLALCWKDDTFTLPEFTKALTVIVPIFAVYTPTVIRALLTASHTIPRRTSKTGAPNLAQKAIAPPAGNNRSVKTQQRVTFAASSISFVVPVLFSGSIFWLILAKINGKFDDFDQFILLLASVESVFGVYMGLVIDNLYPKVEQNLVAHD